MVLVEACNKTFYLNSRIKSSLDIILKKAIPKKWDCLLIVWGREGSGKTSFASQVAGYLDPKGFCVDRVVFNPTQFETVIESVPDESAILWDEAITGASSSEHASRIQQSIIKRLTQIRKKKLKIILCFPYLDMLNRYFISRCMGSYYIYANGFDKRGNGIFFSSRKTERLYNLMKIKFRYDYRKAVSSSRSSFRFNFASTLIMDEPSYEQKKDGARNTVELSSREQVWKERFLKTVLFVKGNGVSMRSIAENLGIGHSYISEEIRQMA